MLILHISFLTVSTHQHVDLFLHGWTIIIYDGWGGALLSDEMTNYNYIYAKRLRLATDRCGLQFSS
jgi:hypothetical protein